MNNIKLLIKHLQSFVTPERYSLFEKVISYRSKYITVVLEDIYQSQNASAVLRTCDCFGIQDVYAIENNNKFEIDPNVAMGASKWLNVSYYNEQEYNTLNAITDLRQKGYRIIATTPHENDVTLHDFDLNKGPAAFFFGTELKGVSDEVKSNADEFMKIPMYGFTESFNISVSAAIVLHHLTNKMRNSEIKWQLTDEQNNEVMLNWLKTTIKGSDLIAKRFLSKNRL